jgi:type VI secretion system protein ImpG
MNRIYRSIIDYYQRELTYLRKMGRLFANKYPKIASFLEMGNTDCKDPHVERLIEAVALLLARVQLKIDNDFPLITNSLLSMLYPHFLEPVPSMSIAKFEIDPNQLKDNLCCKIEKHTHLFAKTNEGHKCKFRTCFPVELWPIEVSFADVKSADHYQLYNKCSNDAYVINIRINSIAAPLHNYNMDSIRFFINGDYSISNSIYELLFGHVSHIAIVHENETSPFFLSPSSIKPVGFQKDENMLPFPPSVQAGFRLLMEYFVFYEKFLFFDIDLSELTMMTSHSYFDLLIVLDRKPDKYLSIDKNTFQTGCTPVINLFEKRTEPVLMDERQSEYLLIPDIRNENIYEIHSIQSVVASLKEEKKYQEINPYFSLNHSDQCEQKQFFHIRRDLCHQKDLKGTDVYISIVDLDFQPEQSTNHTLYANTLCTNRHLAEKMPVHTRLYIETKSPFAQIYTLCKPSPQIDPFREGSVLWRLISHLSMNYLSLSNHQYGLQSIKEMLSLYQISDRTDTGQLIKSINALSTRRVQRLINFEEWRDICTGIEVNLEFTSESGSSPFLLAAVLNHFFSMFISINSFSQLTIKKQHEKRIWKQWAPMIGNQSIL